MFHYLLALSFFFAVCGGSQWPIPYNATNRPEVEPECKPLSRDFCNDGLPYGNFPVWWADDTISLYALVKTRKVLENTVMGYFIKHMTSYVVGFRSNKTGKYYTLSWEPLSRMNDTIAPRILPGGRIVWCNQAAACLREEKHKFESYTVIPFATAGGEFKDAFEVWVKHFNNTMPFLQEVLIYNKTSVFLPSFDGTNFFMQAIKMLKNTGAKFTSWIPLQMTVNSVAGQPPTKLGTEKEIQTLNPSLWGQLMKFYGYLQIATSSDDLRNKISELSVEIYNRHNFYYYYNGEYWHVETESPFNTVYLFVFDSP